MLKRSVVFALVGSVLFLLEACGSGTSTGLAGGGPARTGGTSSTGGTAGTIEIGGAGMGGLVATGGSAGIGGAMGAGGATGIGGFVATGGTGGRSFATTLGASVLVPSSTKAELSHSFGGYPPPSFPADAACEPTLRTYTLDLVAQRVGWDYCTVVGDSPSASSYVPAVGSRSLSASEFESARSALSSVCESSGNGSCWYDIPTVFLTITSAAGSRMYASDDSVPCNSSPPYVEAHAVHNLESVLASLALGGTGEGGSTGSGGTTVTGGATDAGGSMAVGGAAGSTDAGGATSPLGGATAPGGSTSVSSGTPVSAGGTTRASGGTPSSIGGTTAATGGWTNSAGATIDL